MSPCTCDRVGFSNARLYSKLHRIGKPFAFSDGHTTRYRELYTTVSGSIHHVCSIPSLQAYTNGETSHEILKVYVDRALA